MGNEGNRHQEPPPQRDTKKHLVIAYEEHHALVSESLRKTPGGKVEFVKHQVSRIGTPASPITSFLNGESDLFLTDKLQLAYLQGCVRVAVYGTYGGSSSAYLLAPANRIKELQDSPLVHGFLLGLEKMHPDLMIFPSFGLKYQSLEEYRQFAHLIDKTDELHRKSRDPLYHDDMD